MLEKLLECKRPEKIDDISYCKYHRIISQGGLLYFNSSESNPYMLDGSVVSGPDENDNYFNLRSNYELAEPTTFTPTPLVGVLDKLALSFK